MNPPVLALSNLSAISDRDRAPILRDVSLEVARGETCGLVGESGAGKSTIAKAILGILPRTVRVTSGEVKFEGADLLKMKSWPAAPIDRRAHRADPAGPDDRAQPRAANRSATD